MKTIELTQGFFAIVDDEDHALVSEFKWYLHRCGKHKYARRATYDTGKKKDVLLHRVLLGISDETVYIDHKDGNGLNNQKANLRVCSAAENSSNRKTHCNNTSGFKGVNRAKGGWRTRVSLGNKRTHVGYFNTKEDAARAYNEAAIKLHGKFAKLNTF